MNQQLRRAADSPLLKLLEGVVLPLIAGLVVAMWQSQASRLSAIEHKLDQGATSRASLIVQVDEHDKQLDQLQQALDQLDSRDRREDDHASSERQRLESRIHALEQLPALRSWSPQRSSARP